MTPRPDTEDDLVQRTTAEYLEERLGWKSAYAHNREDFGPLLLAPVFGSSTARLSFRPVADDSRDAIGAHHETGSGWCAVLSE